MPKRQQLNIPKFQKFSDARVYAHPFWDYLPNNATHLHRTLGKIGSVPRWKKFIKTREQFIQLRRNGTPKKQVLEKVYKDKHIRLKVVKNWQPTKGTPGLRKGPVESVVDRKLKTWPKNK